MTLRPGPPPSVGVDLFEAPAPSPDMQHEEIAVVFTTPEDTASAARVALSLGTAMGVPVTVVAAQMDSPFQPSGLSGRELIDASEALVSRLRFTGASVRLRACRCHRIVDALRIALRPRSLVFVGGH